MPRGVYERKKEEPVIAPVEVKEVKVTGCKSCSHEIEKHYGSNYKWCNVYKCLCKALK